jgi:hypothetical protein
MGNLFAYVLNFYISVCIAIGVGRSIIGGGGLIFIYSCSQTVKTINFKKVNNAEHEYMNMSSPRLLGRLSQSGNICFTVGQYWLIIKIKGEIPSWSILGEICYIIIENFVVRLPPSIKVIINYNRFKKFSLSPFPPHVWKICTEKIFWQAGHDWKKSCKFFLPHPPIFFFPYAYGNIAYIFIIALYSYFQLVFSIERLISLKSYSIPSLVLPYSLVDSGGARPQNLGRHLSGKLIFWGGKLKRYCYLPMPLSQDFCPPPRRFAPVSKGGDIPRNTAPGGRIS